MVFILHVFFHADPTKAAILSRQLPQIPVTSPTSPPADIFLPSHNPNFMEETSSAGSGNLLNLSTTTPPQPQASSEPGKAGHDFFSQLEWQEDKPNAESAGYVPFEDKIPEDFESASGSSSGSSSDEESSDEFNMFSAPAYPAPKQSGDTGEGLLIGNLGISPTAGDSMGTPSNTTASATLIEFGTESAEKQPVSAPATSVDPFQQQQQQPASSTSDSFGGVVFDPFSSFSSPQTNSAVGDLLGFGASDPLQPATPQTKPAEVPKEPEHPPTQAGEDDFFDPFGSLGGNKATPTLIPTATAPSNFSSGHRFSEPFTGSSTGFLAPQAPLNQGRKLSSPEPFGSQKPPINTNTLSTGFSGNVSFSHPNLASFGATHPSSAVPHANSGWGSGFGIGGSVSQNTSPRRSPSPLPQASSTGNISQPQAKADPFAQFNLKDLSGSMNGAKQPSAKPAPANSQSLHSKPPTGSGYQPYYMQSQARNGTQQHAHSSQVQSNSSKSAGTGIGPKSRSSSAFQTRPQSPNYNPSLFSTVGSKTGMYCGIADVIASGAPYSIVGIPSKPKEDAFGDLLGSNFSSKKNADSKASLKDMKSKNAIENALDPDRAKVLFIKTCSSGISSVDL